MTFVKNTTAYKHKKTGHIYYVILDDVIECTNGREELHYTVYMSAVTTQKFCRERNEFLEKFEAVKL